MLGPDVLEFWLTKDKAVPLSLCSRAFAYASTLSSLLIAASVLALLEPTILTPGR